MTTPNRIHEYVDAYAKRLSEVTDLDPISIIPRGLGFTAVEGHRHGRLAVRAIFRPNGTLLGAWDPEYLTDTCGQCGSRPNVRCCEFGRERVER